MENRAGIEDVCQQSSEGVLGKWTACSELSTLGRPTLQRPAPPVDLRQREDVSRVLCKRQFFSLRRRRFWAVGKWKSWFWISTFPPPTVFLGLGLHLFIW